MSSGAADAPTLHPSAWLARARRRWPRAIALQGPSGRLSFQELEATAAALGRGLLAVAPGRQPLAIGSRSPWSLALALYAGALWGGIPLLPLDLRMPRAIQRILIREAGIRVLLSDHPSDGDLGVPWHPLEALHAAADLRSDRPPKPPPPPREGVHLILTTSGSTGRPKTVLLSGENLAAAVRAAEERLPLGPGDCWLNPLPLCHIGGLAILYRCLWAGATVVLREGFDPREVWRDLWKWGITHLSLVPTLFHRLLEVSREAVPPPSLRAVLLGGAPLDPPCARRARERGWPLCVTYGMTETSSQIATRCGPDAGREAGRVGAPLAGLAVRIRDPDPQGFGRIQVRGPMVMRGYGNPSHRPGLGLQEGWLDTGDLGRWTATGELVVAGRRDAVILTGGEKVHPALLESLLAACPGLDEAAITSVPDPVWGERLVLLYRGEAPPEAVRAFCQTQLPGAWKPRRIHRVTQIPRTSLGKWDRSRLPDLIPRE